MNQDNKDLPEGYKMTELGIFPEHWELAKLNDVLDLLSNGLTLPQNKDGQGIPLTRIETIADEKIDISRVGYLQGLTQKIVERYKLHAGDILFSHINSEPMLGKTAIYEGFPPLLIHGMNLLLIRVNEEICCPEYLNNLFKIYRYKGIFVGLGSRAVGQASINQGKLRFLDIILPPMPEQKEIAKVLSTIQKAIETQDKIIVVPFWRVKLMGEDNKNKADWKP